MSKKKVGLLGGRIEYRIWNDKLKIKKGNPYEFYSQGLPEKIIKIYSGLPIGKKA